MPLNSRDLWVVLKAQDLATRALNSFSRATAGAAKSVQLANLQAMKSSTQRALVSRRLAESLDRITISELQMQRQILQTVAAEKLRTGMTEQENAAFIAQDEALKREILTRQRALNMSRAETVAMQQKIAGYDRDIANVKKAIAVEQEHQRNMRITSNQFRAVAQNAYAASFAVTSLGIASAVGLKGAVDSALEYNRTVALTKTQVDGFAASLQDLSKIGIDVGNKIGVAFDQIQPALYDIFSSTNANLKQATILLTAFSKAAVAGQVDLEDASRSTMQLMNAFRIPFEQVNDVLDLQFQLVRKGVGTYAQFSSVIGRAVPSAVRAGQSLKTLDAMLVFLTRNGLSAAMAAASSGRALDAISNPKTVERLTTLGVKVRDIHGQFLPLVDILQQLHDKLMKLPPADRVKALADILQGSGGTIQARRFLDLVLLQPGQMENFVKFLGDMGDATGQFSQAYNEMANTTAAKAQVLKNNWNAFKVTLGNALIPVFTRLLDIFGRLLNWYNNLSPKTKQFIADFIAVATAVALVVGPILGLVGIFASLMAALAAVGVSLGAVLAVIGGGIAIIAAFGLALYGVNRAGGSVKKVFQDIGSIFSDIWNKAIKPAAHDMADTFRNQLEPALNSFAIFIGDQVAPVVDKFVNMIKKNLIPILRSLLEDIKNVINVGFKVLTWVIGNVLMPTVNRLTEFYKKHEQAINMVVHAVMVAAKWIAIIAGAAFIGALIAAVILVIGYIWLWVQVITHIVEWIITFIGWIKTAIGAVIDFGKMIGNFFSNTVPNAFMAVVRFFESLPGRIWNALMSLPGILSRAINQAFDAFFFAIGFATGVFIKMVDEFPHILTRTFVAMWDDAKHITDVGYNAVINFFKNLGLGIAHYTMVAARAVGSAFMSLYHGTIDTAKKIYNDTLSFFIKLGAGIANFFKNIGPNSKKAFSGAGTWLVQAGKDIIQGLIDGMMSLAQKVVDTAKRIGHDIASGLRKALDSHSPSRVMASIGKDTVLGYMLGIKNAMPLLQNQMTSFPDKIRSSIIVSPAFRQAPQIQQPQNINNINLNVYTQEIRPEFHSAQLGTLLAARIS